MSETMDKLLATNVRVAAANLAKAMDEAVKAGLKVSVIMHNRSIMSPPAEAKSGHLAEVAISRPI